MKLLKLSILSILVSVLFFACETDITVDLPTADEKLIVQGKIENNEKAFVFLSKNIGYFDPVNIPELTEDSDIQDIISALETSVGLIYDSTLLMTITNGNITDTLLPSINFTSFPYFGYQSKAMKGQIGNSYRLDINYNGNNFWSETTIPQPIPIDSVWFNFNENNDTIGTLALLFRDPKNIRNFYTLETQVQEEQIGYYPPYFGSFVFDDAELDGDTIRYYPILKGYDGNDFFETSTEDNDDFSAKAFYRFGSTVNIKMSSIDVASFVFWMSYFKHLGTAGNPFTNPATLKTNINGENCDGIWAGYGAEILTVQIDSSLLID
jgi:hypothetical protein